MGHGEGLPVEPVEFYEKGGRDKGVELQKNPTQQFFDKMPEKTDLFPEYAGEVFPKPLIGEGVSVNEVEGAPLVMENLPREVNQRQTMQTAGHGPMVIDETSAVRPYEGTGGLVVIGHEKLPVLFGAIVEEVRSIELRPRLLKDREPSPASGQYLLLRLIVELIETAFEKGGVDECDVELTATACRAPFGTADALACVCHGAAKPSVHHVKQSTVFIQDIVHGLIKEKAGHHPAFRHNLASFLTFAVRRQALTW